jgi:nucleoside-diphosphate kinase
VVTKELILAHYDEVIRNNPSIPLAEMFLKEYVGQTITALELSSSNPNFIQDVRTYLGATDPAKADPGSLRGRYGEDSMAKAMEEGRTVKNLLHASDSAEAAERELNLWFS